MEMTYHCGVERAYRVQKIVEQIGMGQIIKKRFVRNCYSCVTDTGVVIVKTADEMKIVTIYVATVRDLYFIFDSVKKVPSYLVRKVNHNQTLFTRNGKTIWE